MISEPKHKYGKNVLLYDCINTCVFPFHFGSMKMLIFN